jgi:hypothetical protein
MFGMVKYAAGNLYAITVFLCLSCLVFRESVRAQAYPLKVSANKRYLVDQNTVPFLIAGDAPQALMVNISEADADMYFADRASHGFNCLWINLLCADYTGGRSDASTYDGVLPWTTAGDLSTPNEAYFSHCDRVLRLAANRGLVVFLDPAETGSFLSVMLANGVTKCRNYGRYLGNRYKSFDNIVWLSGNDYQDWSSAANDTVVTAVALGIKDNDLRHIHTIELNYIVSGSLDDPKWAPIVSLNASYTYCPTYAQVLKDYNRTNFQPVFLIEANYEFESLQGPVTTAAILRRQEYWTNLSGATGQFYGNGYIWPFKSGWKDNLVTPGATQMAFVKTLFEPRPWYNLVPDQDHSVVTAGYGTFSNTGHVADNYCATAARTPDGGLVLAFLPSGQTVTVDMTKLGSSAKAQWYDPTNGTYATISGSPFPNIGPRNFTPPGANSAGDKDFVLVLEATASVSSRMNTRIPEDVTVKTVYNPATQTVAIIVSGKESMAVAVIYDAAGRQVAVLPAEGFRGESAKAGACTLWWDASGVPCGVYLLQVQTQHAAVVRPFVKTW